MSRIAIVGGHGKIALQAAKILSTEGHEVTSLIRKPEQRAEIEGAGASASIIDLESASQDELAAVFRGHDAVVFSAGAGGGSPERTYAVDRDAAIKTMDAASAAGVERYVMVSYMGAGPDHGVPEDDSFYPYAESKAEADTHLKGTDLAWTILGPSMLSDDPATGAIEVGQSGSGSAARGNVAQVIAAVLTDESTIRRTIEFVDGPTPIRDAVSAE
ncbi:SDR family oxidoreductase [Dietzia alimentaria]|uniref:SDR family oxidoreductase n=1 Tax=Dietzia alimentaria TaxID=665550 RepID=UPI000299F610|nr:SDR family oxidoreductase [Dietzia alimentaria]